MRALLADDAAQVELLMLRLLEKRKTEYIGNITVGLDGIDFVSVLFYRF